MEQLVVNGFALSKRRGTLWKNFLFVLKTLQDLKIPCDVWIDGSFLTHKVDPDDVDFVVDIPVDFLPLATAEQQSFIENLSDQLYRTSDDLHSFVMFNAPQGHPLGLDMNAVHDQWHKDFGFSYVAKSPKGIAVVEVRP
jgi:hypothetical protein